MAFYRPNPDWFWQLVGYDGAKHQSAPTYGSRVAVNTKLIDSLTQIIASLTEDERPALLRWPNYSLNAHRLRDSGHNHQGVNSLADRKSLLKQTGGLGSQSSSEDFGFEPRTFSPWLRANPRDRPRPLRNEPFIGMWQDREDMADSTDWVRSIRG